MSEIKSAQCANFTAALGESFRFCTLDGTGRPCGQLLTGKVQKIRRVGRKMVVDLYIPAKSCTHTYYAAEIYPRVPENRRRTP